MKCPYCGSYDSYVIDSRLSPDRKERRRRRQCCICDKRFTTKEWTEKREFNNEQGKVHTEDNQALRSSV